MSPRLTPAAALLVAFSLAACAGIPAAPAAPAASASSPASTPVATGSAATLVPNPAESSAAPSATATPDSGNVNAPVTPALSIEPVSALAIRVTLADPSARAWRVSVAGMDDTAERWTLTVETGDVAPVITTTETVSGVDGEPQELAGLEAGNATGRICSVAMPVCVRAASVVLPHDGNGTLVLEISRTDTTTALSVTGSTAGWPAEPFLLGPWTTTTAFPWGA